MERGGGNACILEGLPRGLEKEALLGIDGECLARTNTEEGGIEVVGLIEEAPLARVDFARRLGIGVVESVGDPSAVLREGGDGVLSITEEPPEILGRANAARIAATHRHDRDRLLLSTLEIF